MILYLHLTWIRIFFEHRLALSIYKFRKYTSNSKMSTFIKINACERLRLDYNVNNYAAFQKVQIKKTFKYYPYCYCICFTFTFIHLLSPFLNAFNVANSSWSQGHEMYNNICINGSLINFNLTLPCMYICFWINIFVIL